MLELFRSPRRAMVWFVEASLLSLLAVCTAGLMRGWPHALGPLPVLCALLTCVVAQASMYYHGLYGPRPQRGPHLVLGFVRALGVAFALLWALLHVVPRAGAFRSVLASS